MAAYEPTTYTVNGFEEFMNKVKELEGEGKEIYCMFSGSKDVNGQSWCPDCVTAEPVVKGCLKKMPETAVFVYCLVGGRDYWKDKQNEFRVNSNLKLTGVPTLMKWGQSAQKLVENQLFKPDLIEMLFEEDP